MGVGDTGAAVDAEQLSQSMGTAQKAKIPHIHWWFQEEETNSDADSTAE